MKTTRCEVCGEIFDARRTGITVCLPCKQALAEPEFKRECGICGSALTEKRQRKYCSPACAKIAHNRKAEQKRLLAKTKDTAFSDYECASAQAKRAGKWISYGEFMAAKNAAKETKIGG